MADPDFISYLWPHAVAAGEATGIDPRIIAGQAAVESNWGRNFVGNNLFGIKGPGVSAGTTEVYGGVPVGTTASFRSFATPADSVGGYVDLVKNNPRYGAMRGADGIDAQLRELGRSGYATDPAYATKVRDAASAIDGVVRKTTGANWSGGPGTPTDIQTALGYTGQDTMPAAARTKDEPTSSFFTDLGIDPKGGGKPAAAAAAAPKPAFGRTYDSVVDTAGAAAAGAISGVPIACPYLLGGVQRTAAAIRSLKNDTPFSQELANVRTIGSENAAAHPYADTAGHVAGAVAGYGLAAANIPGAATALGMTGTRLLPQMAYGAGSNALIGGFDAGARNENMLTGAGFGGIGGFFGPAAGKAIGSATNSLVQAAQDYLPTGIPGVSRSAANMANTVINADGPGAIRNMLTDMGPLGMIADAGPSSRGLTAGLVLRPSEARSTIEGALRERATGANARLTTDLDAAIGRAPVPSQVEAGIAANRDALGPQYQEVMRGASAVDTRPLANNLESTAINLRGPEARAVNQVRDMLNIPGTNQLDPHPQALLSTRQSIDGLMANESNPQVIRQLTIARQSVDDELARAVPGIKDVDAKYSELMSQSGALKTGSRFSIAGARLFGLKTLPLTSPRAPIRRER